MKKSETHSHTSAEAVQPPGAGGVLAACPGWAVDPDATTLNLVAAAREWAQTFDPPLPLAVGVLGEAPGAGDLRAYGVDTVFRCRAADVTTPVQTLGETVGRLAAELDAAWVFTTADGPLYGLGTFVAAHLQAPAVSHCLALERDETGACLAWRPLHQGRLFEQIDLSDPAVRVVSWEAGALPPAPSPVSPDTVAPVAWGLHPSPPAAAICPERLISGDPRTLPLEVAETILAVGRGVTPGGMPLVEKMADALAASLGGTRPAVDVEMLPYERQIGQTGVTASPRLLLTCGISGAKEFTVGIEGARTVIAINTDPQARIHQMADLGLVGDWRAIFTKTLETLLSSQQNPRLQE